MVRRTRRQLSWIRRTSRLTYSRAWLSISRSSRPRCLTRSTRLCLLSARSHWVGRTEAMRFSSEPGWRWLWRLRLGTAERSELTWRWTIWMKWWAFVLILATIELADLGHRLSVGLVTFSVVVLVMFWNFWGFWVEVHVMKKCFWSAGWWWLDCVGHWWWDLGLIVLVWVWLCWYGFVVIGFLIWV